MRRKAQAPSQGASLRDQGHRAIASGDLAGAQEAYQKAIELGLRDADVCNNLACIYDRLSIQAEQARELFRMAMHLAPNNASFRNNLEDLLRRQAFALTNAGRFREALSLCEERVALLPQSALAHRELGVCHWKLGHMDAAARYLVQAINLQPDARTYDDLGLVFLDTNHMAEAQGAFHQALQLDPKSADALSHLGLLANMTGLTGVALKFFKRALAISPDSWTLHNNLALVYREQGELQLCRDHYEQAVRLNPTRQDLYSAYLLSLNSDPQADPAWVASQHRRFDTLAAAPARALPPSDRDPHRRLRVGYLSPDFRFHSVAFFIAPLFAHHDPKVVETVAYYSGLTRDRMTERIRQATKEFNHVYRMSDDDLAARIQEDRIDVLVELSGHTSENRMAMMSRRVAPVQITYLGYPNTTGLSQMDYRLTDAVADPEGPCDAWCSETLVRLDGGFLAYQPPEDYAGAESVALPAGKAGHVTYGSFNNLTKINDGVLEAWATIIARIPNSVLLLKARGLRDEAVQARLFAAFAARGIDAQTRVRLMPHQLSPLDHVTVYNEVDIALDTFPYNGTTTTCEALWMGTPVVTFAGDRHAARVGASILTHAGLPDLVARDRQSYIELAVTLGMDRDKLAKIRRGLRERFAQSPVMDGARLARETEKIIRVAWQAFCAGKTPPA